MTQQYTPAQLEAWAGSTAKHPEVITKEMWIERVALFAEAKLHAPALARLVLEKEKEIAALQAFKNYVHERLDKAGIPSHPDGEHSKAGCRIGDRLDIALAARKAMKETSDE